MDPSALPGYHWEAPGAPLTKTRPARACDFKHMALSITAHHFQRIPLCFTLCIICLQKTRRRPTKDDIKRRINRAVSVLSFRYDYCMPEPPSLVAPCICTSRPGWPSCTASLNFIYPNQWLEREHEMFRQSVHACSRVTASSLLPWQNVIAFAS